MADVIPLRRASPEPPSIEELMARMRSHLLVGAMLMEHPYVQKRLVQRGVTLRQVLDVLDNGEPVSGPTLDKWGDWRIKLSRRVAGRLVQVVVAISEKYFSVVTVI